MKDLQKKLDKNMIEMIQDLKKEDVVDIMLRYMTFDDKVHYLNQMLV